MYDAEPYRTILGLPPSWAGGQRESRYALVSWQFTTWIEAEIPRLPHPRCEADPRPLNGTREPAQGSLRARHHHHIPRIRGARGIDQGAYSPVLTYCHVDAESSEPSLFTYLTPLGLSNGRIFARAVPPASIIIPRSQEYIIILMPLAIQL